MNNGETAAKISMLLLYKSMIEHLENTEFNFEQVCPPYDNDWMCTDENYDGAPDGGGIIGRGNSHELALLDYMRQYEELL